MDFNICHTEPVCSDGENGSRTGAEGEKNAASVGGGASATVGDMDGE